MPTSWSGNASEEIRIRYLTLVAILALVATACTSGQQQESVASSNVELTDDSGLETTTAIREPSSTSGPAVTVSENTESAPTEVVVVYEETFDETDSTELEGLWRNAAVETPPGGGGAVLGRFANQTVRLAIPDLPAHGLVTVAFDLHAIGSWDGVDSDDRWQMDIDGYVVVNTSFESGTGDQAYPERRTVGEHPAGTGAVSHDTLGYEAFGDTTYHFEETFRHDADTVRIGFRALRLGDLDDESWAVDNITVTVAQLTDDDPSELTLHLTPGAITVEGTVAAGEETLVTSAVERREGGSVSLDLVETISPLWVREIIDIVSQVQGSHDLVIEIGNGTATIAGTTFGQRWADEVQDGLDQILGDAVAATFDIVARTDTELAEVVESHAILFDSGEAAVPSGATDAIEDLADLLEANPELEIEVRGHADGQGARDNNQALSQDRAQAVGAALEAAGVDARRLEITWTGENDPAVADTEDTAETLNRRVSFRVRQG